MHIEHEPSFLQALREPVNLFVGAGFSVLSCDREGRPLPTGSKLAAELIEHFDVGHLSDVPLPQLCTIISRSRRDELRSYLMERFTVTQYDERYHAIERLRLRNIFTTNIDNLLHEVFKASPQCYLNDANLNGPVYKNRLAIDFYTLHGSVLDPRSEMRFGAVEVASSFGADQDRWRYLRSQIRQHPTLFLGYSFSDAATLEAIAPHVERTGSPSDAWVLLLPPVDRATLEYFQALNLHTIEGTVSDFLDFANALPDLQAVSGATGPGAVEDRFSDFAVPSVGSVFKRPIIEFFRGSAPTWSDVFSGSLYRTSHYFAIRDRIHAHQDTIITGVPTSGKSTLLMQLAAEISFQGHKLILDGASQAQARLIVRRLLGEPCLVFLDNVADDIDAFAVFQAAPNIVAVAAARDYALSSSGYRLQNLRGLVLDITGLTDGDLQGCRASIPGSIRQLDYTEIEVTEGVRPSLYEFVASNTTEPTIQERLDAALRRLRTESPQLAEMLLLTGYVHSCGTPLSMDMALAYWRDRIKDYREIYAMMRDVGALLTEYEGDLATEDQDYFAARSLLAADSIIRAADSSLFRKVLLTFHRNISHYRICHYNVFRRRAYDSRVVDRAFPSWEDGKAFYEEVYEKKPSPYIRQHEALFLNARRAYSEAFLAIDKALAEAGSHNFTIKNSHAIILFRANIGLGDSSEVREQLDKSMQILMECYESDRRKGFHSQTFADHAVQYWDRYRDANAKAYLRYADRWLAEQAVAEPWLRDIVRLQKLVRTRLVV